MAYEKLYNEIYAVVALKYLWRGYRSGFFKWESPDWLNRREDIGLEVSQALLPKDGQAEKFLESYIGRRSEDIPEEARAKYEGKLYFYNGRLWALLDGEGDSRSYKDKVLYRFGKKLEKLNSNYTVCGCNALYLYAHAQPEKISEVKRIMRAMSEKQEECENCFQLVFIDCDSSIFMLDFRTGRVMEMPVAEKAMLFLNEKTEKLRNSNDWDDDSEF